MKTNGSCGTASFTSGLGSRAVNSWQYWIAVATPDINGCLSKVVRVLSGQLTIVEGQEERVLEAGDRLVRQPVRRDLSKCVENALPLFGRAHAHVGSSRGKRSAASSRRQNLSVHCVRDSQKSASRLIRYRRMCQPREESVSYPAVVFFGQERERPGVKERDPSDQRRVTERWP